jgi:flagellar hook-associated protein 1 FlgK
MKTNILSIGQSGLSSTKKGIQTSAHNLANVHTEGFTRQRTNQATNHVEFSENVVMGTGSYVKKVERMHNGQVTHKINISTSEDEYLKERFDQLSLLENTYNEMENERLNQLMARFFNSFRNLAANPDNGTVKALVAEDAKILIRNFQSVYSKVTELSDSLNIRMDEAVNDINSLLSGVTELNSKILQIESAHGEAGDLRDSRDLKIHELSKFFKLNTYQDEIGRYTVNAENIGTIVSGPIAQKFTSHSPPPENKEDYFQNGKEIYINDRKKGSRFQQGKLSAMVSTRNNEFVKIQKKLDSIAWTFANAVNAIHRKGNTTAYVKDGQVMPERTNINFFDVPEGQFRSAELLDLTDEIKEGSHNLALSYRKGALGDNRIAIAISQLSHEKIADKMTKTLEEDYLQAISEVALTLSKTKVDKEQTESVLASLNAMREQTSGVSIDEETAKMAQMQNAYNASARVIKVADEMMQTVLDLKR